MGSLAQVGLALATAVGAWINLLLVLGFAVRAGYLELDRAFVQSLAKFFVAGVVLGRGAVAGRTPCCGAFCAAERRCAMRPTLVVLIAVGAVVYAGSILLLFGRGWLRSLVRQLKPFALPRDPLQYGCKYHAAETEIRWLPSNSASVKACFARKTMR